MTEPNMDLAHLGHVEILTPKPDESLKFFTQVFGLTESGRKGDSVYLRAWDDYERSTLKLTASKSSGLGHCAFRTRSPCDPAGQVEVEQKILAQRFLGRQAQGGDHLAQGRQLIWPSFI